MLDRQPSDGLNRGGGKVGEVLDRACWMVLWEC